MRRYVCMYPCNVYMYVVFMYVCMYVFMYACMYVYMYLEDRRRSVGGLAGRH